METRVASLGVAVHRKRLKKQNRKKEKKKSLLKKIVDYLKSDSYMYAPLACSSQSSDFSSSNTLSTSPAGVDKTRKPREESPRKLLEKVGVYLKSDYYMYAPLVYPQPSHDLDSYSNTVNPAYTGQVWHLKRVTAEVSTRKMTKKIDQPTKRTENIVREDQPSDNASLKNSTVVQQTLAHQEKVKQMVQKKWKGKLETERRNVVVE